MIENFTEFKKYLSKEEPFKGKYFAWNGKRYFDAFQFIPFMPVHLIISVDYGIDTREFEDDISILSKEKEERKRREWHHISEETFQQDFGKKVKEFILKLGKKVSLLTYHSSKDIEEFISSHPESIELIGPEIELKDYLDCKTTLPPDLPGIGIPPLPGEIRKISETNFGELVEKYGETLVIQWGIGDSGSGTSFISSKDAFEKLKATKAGELVKISKFLDGYSIAICAVAYGDSVILSQPNVQVVGCPECVTKRATYCASDFTVSKYFSPKRMKQIYDYTLKVGRWMKSKGYRGLFGIDFITSKDDPDSVYISECNARFTGEGQFYTDYQKMANQVPLQFFHIAEYTGIDIPKPEIESYNESLKPLEGSCVTLHNILEKDAVVGNQVIPGVYRLKNNKLQHIRPGLMLSDCKDKDEFVISCAVPLKGEIVEPAASILRFQTFKSVVDNTYKRFNEWTKNLVGLLRKELNLKEL